MQSLLRHLRRAALLQAGEGPADNQLLEAFVARRDEAAFETLLRRHGPMVLGVCQRVLRHTQDAEDAFQATFLVLARKAGSLRSRELLPNWLYGVAHRTALKARAMNAHRRDRDREARAAPATEALATEDKNELLERLDAELSRLPDKYRAAVVLCELEGKSRKEAARLLRVPEGTLSWRLAQARKMLADRLARHGVLPAGGAVASLLAPGASSAGVPSALVAATVKAAVQSAAGQALAAGVVSAHVVALTQGVLKAMLLSKLKSVWAVALLVSLTAAAGVTYRTVAAEPGRGGTTGFSTRPLADELEELRLEIAALRQGLLATRERVKTLEGEVGTLKTRVQPAGAGMGGAMGGGGGGMGGGGMFGGGGGGVGMGGGGGMGMGSPGGGLKGAKGGAASMGGLGGGGASNKAPVPPTKSVPALLAEAESALKKLRADPNDKQAAEALERVLQRLKEQAQPERKPDTPKRP